VRPRFASGAAVVHGPELFDDAGRNPKSDGFSLALICDELFCGKKPFPLTLSTASVIRKAASLKPADRPAITDELYPSLREAISCEWAPSSARRPTIAELCDGLRKAIPDVCVEFTKEMQGFENWECEQ
jgi:serine/threonine protein kinase